MQVYSDTSTTWPLLQSKTEQKFKSGLFNVSAEYIRPVGNTNLPGTIKTSIGTVDVWPEPTINVGTDGFERINATGYGVWDTTAEEVTYGYELGELVVTFTLIDKCFQLNGCGDGTPCGSILAITQVVRNIPVIIEAVHISKIGSSIPAAPTMKAFYPSGIELPATINISTIEPSVSPQKYSGIFDSDIFTPSRLVNVKKNTFGEVEETEVVYQCVPYVNFGTFDMITDC